MNFSMGVLVVGVATDGNAWATWAGLFAGVSALAAVSTAWFALQSLKAAMEDSAERSRPVVVAELKPDPTSFNRVIFAVVNYGVGSAHNVQVTFDPAPLVIANDPREVGIADAIDERWSRPLNLLPPGGQRRNVYYELDDETNENDQPLPDAFTAHVTYDAPRGGKPHTYTESFELSMRDWLNETRAEDTTKGAETKRVAAALEAIARGVGRVS